MWNKYAPSLCKCYATPCYPNKRQIETKTGYFLQIQNVFPSTYIQYCMLSPERHPVGYSWESPIQCRPSLTPYLSLPRCLTLAYRHQWTTLMIFVLACSVFEESQNYQTCHPHRWRGQVSLGCRQLHGTLNSTMDGEVNLGCKVGNMPRKGSWLLAPATATCWG